MQKIYIPESGMHKCIPYGYVRRGDHTDRLLSRHNKRAAAFPSGEGGFPNVNALTFGKTEEDEPLPTSLRSATLPKGEGIRPVILQKSHCRKAIIAAGIPLALPGDI